MITVTSQVSAACCSRAHTQLRWACMVTAAPAGEPLANKFSPQRVFSWIKRGCNESLEVLPHAAHLQGTSGSWRVILVFTWDTSCQTSSGGALLPALAMPVSKPNVCLFAELFGTQKPNWHLQCANMGTSHTFQEVWGGWLMPQLSGLFQEPKLRVLTFTWQLLHLQSKFNTLLQEWWGGGGCCVCFQKWWTSL